MVRAPRSGPAVLLSALAAALLLARPAHAADPIDTDGPDFVESSEVVPKGRFQYEVDFTSTRNRRTPAEGPTTSTPALLKYGFADNLELRIAPDGYLRRDGAAGAGDTAIGLKWHTQDRDAAAGIPAVSWILHVDAPTGARAFRGEGLRPSLRSVITWDLPRDFALGVMPGVKYDARVDGHRYASAILGAVLNKRFSEHVRAFVEVSVPQAARQRDGGVVASWDVGAAYLVNADLQVGVRAGVAANLSTPRSFALFEVAQRF